jgi:hypothetical protein
MNEESDRHDYSIKVEKRRIGLNPYRRAIYRSGWPGAVKRAASLIEQSSSAGSQELGLSRNFSQTSPNGRRRGTIADLSD